MRLRSSTSLEKAEASDSKAHETMQEDNYSTQAVWGSPQSNPPEDHRLSPSPPLGEAGPSNPAPANSHRGQQSYPENYHSGTDFLLYDSWRNDADEYDYEEQGINSQSPHIHSQSEPEPYDTSNPNSQPPPAAPSPPANDYGHIANNDGHENRNRPFAPLQTSPPIQRYTQAREAWSPAAPMSAEQRREILTESIPDLDLKRDRGYNDKMEEDLSKLTEEGRKRKRPRRRKERGSSPNDRQGKGRDRDSDRDRRGGQQGAGQAVRSS